MLPIDISYCPRLLSSWLGVAFWNMTAHINCVKLDGREAKSSEVTVSMLKTWDAKLGCSLYVYKQRADLSGAKELLWTLHCPLLETWLSVKLLLHRLTVSLQEALKGGLAAGKNTSCLCPTSFSSFSCSWAITIDNISSTRLARANRRRPICVHLCRRRHAYSFFYPAQSGDRCRDLSKQLLKVYLWKPVAKTKRCVLSWIYAKMVKKLTFSRPSVSICCWPAGVF